MKTTQKPSSIVPQSQDYIHTLEELNASLITERDDFKRRYYQVLEELRLARHHRFGASSEVDTQQAELFDIEDDTAEDPVYNCEQHEPCSAKSKPKRQPLPKDLPRVVIRHEPEHEQCPDCGKSLHCIGEDIPRNSFLFPQR